MKIAAKKAQTAAAADFAWPRITIGSDLDALRFAIKNKTFILLNGRPPLHSYDLGQDGQSLEETWAKKNTQLFNMGLHPFGDRVTTIRFDDENSKVKVFTEFSKYDVLYNSVEVFSLQNVFGLEHKYRDELVGYRVLDWFDIKKGADIDIDLLQDGTSCLVKKIQLFASTRRDGDHTSKDLVSESFLSRAQLDSVDYSDTMARFKTIKMLTDIGAKGVELELWKRDVLPVFNLKRLS